MARTTVQISDDLMLQLKLVAEAQGMTVSVLVRQAVERVIADYEKGHLSAIVGLFDGPPVLGERHEEDVLAELGFGQEDPDGVRR